MNVYTYVLNLSVDYRPQTKSAKVKFLHLSVHRGSTWTGTPSLRAGTPPRKVPPGQVHLLQVHPQQVPPGQVHLLQVHPHLAGTLPIRYTPGQVHPPPPTWAGTPPQAGTPQQVHPPAGTPPPGRYYEIRSMSGWYASYWNASLFLFSCLFSNILPEICYEAYSAAEMPHSGCTLKFYFYYLQNKTLINGAQKNLRFRST